MDSLVCVLKRKVSLTKTYVEVGADSWLHLVVLIRHHLLGAGWRVVLTLHHLEMLLVLHVLHVGVASIKVVVHLF